MDGTAGQTCSTRRSPAPRPATLLLLIEPRLVGKHRHDDALHSQTFLTMGNERRRSYSHLRRPAPAGASCLANWLQERDEVHHPHPATDSLTHFGKGASFLGSRPLKRVRLVRRNLDLAA